MSKSRKRVIAALFHSGLAAFRAVQAVRGTKYRIFRIDPAKSEKLSEHKPLILRHN